MPCFRKNGYACVRNDRGIKSKDRSGEGRILNKSDISIARSLIDAS